jgi:hypothetical protein
MILAYIYTVLKRVSKIICTNEPLSKVLYGITRYTTFNHRHFRPKDSIPGQPRHLSENVDMHCEQHYDHYDIPTQSISENVRASVWCYVTARLTMLLSASRTRVDKRNLGTVFTGLWQHVYILH